MSQLKLWLEKKLPAEFCYAPGWTSGSMARPKMFPNMQLLDGRLMPSFGLGVYRCLGGFQLGRETGRNIMGRSEIIFEIMCIYIQISIYIIMFKHLSTSYHLHHLHIYILYTYAKLFKYITYIYMIPVSGFLPPPPTPPQCDDPVHTTHCSNDYMAAALLL